MWREVGHGGASAQCGGVKLNWAPAPCGVKLDTLSVAALCCLPWSPLMASSGARLDVTLPASLRHALVYYCTIRDGTVHCGFVFSGTLSLGLVLGRRQYDCCTSWQHHCRTSGGPAAQSLCRHPMCDRVTAPAASGVVPCNLVCGSRQHGAKYSLLRCRP